MLLQLKTSSHSSVGDVPGIVRPNFVVVPLVTYLKAIFNLKSSTHSARDQLFFLIQTIVHIHGLNIPNLEYRSGGDIAKFI